MEKTRRIFYAASALFGFILALQLLGESTQALSPLIEGYLKEYVASDFSALGLGWFAAYIVLNGATSAAIGIALFESGLVTLSQLFMVVGGSRLGAAFIVIFIGFLEYIQGKNDSLADSCSVGVLTFILTYTVYIPAIILGFFLIRFFELAFLETSGPVVLRYSLTSIFTPIVDFISGVSPASVVFMGSILILVASLKQFDKAFKGLGKDKMREDYMRFLITNRWVAFGVGAFITLVTTSVALSLGIIVPLYNKGYLKREEIIPYVLGANITTMISSIIAAIVLDSIVGMKAILVLTATITITTLVVLLVYDKYYALVKRMFDWTVSTDKNLMYFAAALTVIPLMLILLF